MPHRDGIAVGPPSKHDHDLEANKARNMRALGEHLMARGKPIQGREHAGYKSRSMRAIGAQVMCR
jgi:hypothetical protein